MKTTGVTRPVDALGRVVLPIEIREALGINPKDLVEINVLGDEIILRKNTRSCLFCGTSEDLLTYENRKICKKCIVNLINLES